MFSNRGAPRVGDGGVRKPPKYEGNETGATVVAATVVGATTTPDREPGIGAATSRFTGANSAERRCTVAATTRLLAVLVVATRPPTARTAAPRLLPTVGEAEEADTELAESAGAAASSAWATPAPANATPTPNVNTPAPSHPYG